MRVRLNGQEFTAEKNTSLQTLIATIGTDPSRVVVEHNLVIRPPETWPAIILEEEDQIEIVSFVGGG